MKTQQEQKSRLCDYCNDTTALLYCRADSAKLCISCDREVHSTNQLFSKHTRSLLCDACDNSPVSIFCETEHSVFCQNCDWERHNLSVSCEQHNRRPIEGFSGFPSVSEFVSILGLEDLGDKIKNNDDKYLVFNDGLVGCGDDGSGFGDGYSDLLGWETPAVVSIDDLIVSSDSDGNNFQALGVPPLPKNRNAVCGQHKEEMLRQLCDLAGLEFDSNWENPKTEPVSLLQSAARSNMQTGNLYTDGEPDAQPASLPTYEENVFNWLSDSEAGNQGSLPSTLPSNNFEGPVVADKQSNIDGGVSCANGSHEVEMQHTVPSGIIQFIPKVGSHEINSQERDSALSRYKEKKKTRSLCKIHWWILIAGKCDLKSELTHCCSKKNFRYDKHIRYESRKARAESRTRIKGRFAKMDR